MSVVLSTDGGYVNGQNMGKPVNDTFGYLTQTAGTPIVRVIPPCLDARSVAGSFRYRPAATAHLLTIMVSQAESVVTSDVLAGATVIPIGGVMNGFDGSPIAANDYIIVQYEDGTWGSILVTSFTGTNITVPATSQKILKNSKVFLMGAAADHPNRTFQTVASTVYDFVSGDFRVRAATSSKKESPLLFYSPNGTNAGFLEFLNYWFD